MTGEITFSDGVGSVELKRGQLRFWYDDETDEVIIQATKGTLLVRPRAGNAIAIVGERP